MTKIGVISLMLVLVVAGCHRRTEGQPSMLGRLNAVGAAIEMFKLDHDRLPASLDDLLPATNGLSGGALSGYIRPEGLLDSWGQRLSFTTQSNRYELRSAGPDCAFGTTDDIVKTKEK